MHFFHVLSISRLFQLSPSRFIIIAFRVKEINNLYGSQISKRTLHHDEGNFLETTRSSSDKLSRSRDCAWFLILIWLTVSIKPAAIYDRILDVQMQAYGRFIIMTSNMQVYAFNPYSLSFFFSFHTAEYTFLTYSLPIVIILSRNNNNKIFQFKQFQ